jgi:hypothetical protein
MQFSVAVQLKPARSSGTHTGHRSRPCPERRWGREPHEEGHLRRALRRGAQGVTATGGALVLLDPAGDHRLTTWDGHMVDQGVTASRPIPV